MHPLRTHAKPWPDSIRFRLVEDDSFLENHAIKHLWNPFEAACLIAGYQPGEIVGGVAIVGVVLGHAMSNDDIDKFVSNDPEAAFHIITITQAVVEKWEARSAPAVEIVEWALSKGYMWNSPFVRRVLGRVPEHAHSEEIARLHGKVAELETALKKMTDGRGKHFEKWRLQILGCALQEVVKLAPGLEGKIDKLMHGEKISASGLATYLDANRADVNLPPESAAGFAFTSIENALRLALDAANSPSSAVTKVTTD